MKSRIFSIATSVLFAFAAAAQVAPQPTFIDTFASPAGVSGEGGSSAALIRGIGRAANTGVAFTDREAFVGDVGGVSWKRLTVPLGLADRIAGAEIEAGGVIRLVISNRIIGRFSLMVTRDGGEQWSQLPIAIRPEDLDEADFSSGELTSADGVLRLSIRLMSSSNFERRAKYSSNDDGRSWNLIESRSDLAKGDDLTQAARLGRLGRSASIPSDEMVVMAAGERSPWILTQSGTCFGYKSGCVQETRLRTATGADITPQAIRGLAEAERALARSSAGRSIGAAMPPGGNTRISLNRGFDKCDSPTVSQMQIWWNTSPYFDMNIYMSGRNRACAAQPNLSAAWIDQVTAMGWGLIPTVVGYQSPCTSSTTTAKLSYDPATAEQQGRGEADIAVTAAINLGLTAGSILYYDMESYSETVSTPGCRVATTAFLKGWTDRIKELNYKSGVYGSPTNAVNDWIGIPEPSRMEAVWLARWDLVMSVWTYNSPSPTVPTNVWANHQRIKQWQNPHNETWGGVTFNIDGDIADGPVAGLTVAKNKNADFDGDGKSDVSIFRPDAGLWYYLNSSNGSAGGVAFGAPGDIPVPGDFDGDGKTDTAVFRPADGVWHLLTKAGVYTSRAFGSPGDIPVAADYNNDGKTDLAVFRPSNSIWYIANSDSQGTFTFVQFGQAGDKPAPADYDGDGKADIAVFRPAGATGTEWWIQKSSGGVFATQFGVSSDQAVPVDFTGDGKADVAFWRPSTGEWFILRSEDLTYYAFPFGTVGDVAAPGDLDGDGKADPTVFRPSNAVWYMLRSQAGFTAVQFGLSGDRPVENAYLPQ
ncbi:MAG: DUF1906 domain-containing protein [Pyrinomonadaceae bacterium]|nr:DUF1906 domain-containing protein [Pyrinomonadaceae bacterium]